MNYYERHLGDYSKDTSHLSMAEHGAYCLLLDRYYGAESGIPEELVYRVTRARTTTEKKAVDFVLREFFVLVDGIWINKRADEEIEKAQNRINAARENGKKGGRKINDSEKKMGSVKYLTFQMSDILHEEKTQSNQGADEPDGFPLGLPNGTQHITQHKAHHTPHVSKPPITPQGGLSVSKRSPVALRTFITACKESGVKSIPEDDPVFNFADQAGIDDEWVRICWREFVARYADTGKKYTDWRKTFRNAVRGNWFKIWYMDAEGKMMLTSQGRTLMTAHKGE